MLKELKYMVMWAAFVWLIITMWEVQQTLPV